MPPLTKFFHPHPSYRLLGAPMHDQCQGIDRFVVEQEDHLTGST